MGYLLYQERSRPGRSSGIDLSPYTQYDILETSKSLRSNDIKKVYHQLRGRTNRCAIFGANPSTGGLLGKMWNTTKILCLFRELNYRSDSSTNFHAWWLTTAVYSNQTLHSDTIETTKYSSRLVQIQVQDGGLLLVGWKKTVEIKYLRGFWWKSFDNYGIVSFS